MSNSKPLKVTISGSNPATPIKKVISKNADLSKELPKLLDTLDYSRPAICSCQVGKGKTYAVIHGILPWATKKNYRLLYISSRIANNDQLKEEIISEIGQEHLLEELTAEGIRAKEDFGNCTILSYHKTHQYMLYDPDKIRGYDIVIVDEVQAFLEDSTFVGFTGELLRNIPRFFAGAVRLYLSATPDDILPLLAEAEAPHTITILHMPRDYSFVDVHFFSKKEVIQKEINCDKSTKKWFVFISGIAAGQQFAKGLVHPYCLLNSEERTNNPEQWNNVISQKNSSKR